jgi:hypothetical protein
MITVARVISVSDVFGNGGWLAGAITLLDIQFCDIQFGGGGVI